MANYPVTLPTLSDVSRQPKFNMAACTTEVRVSLEWYVTSTKFQRILYIFGHAVLTGDTADIARCRPTTEIQNGGL